MDLKRILRKIVDKLFGNLVFNYILLESKPDISDNTCAVFDEMIRRNLNQKYKIIWFVDDINHTVGKIKNVKYISNSSPIRYWYKFFAKCGISCNNKIYSYRKGQFSMFLGHGIPIKSLRAAEIKMSDKIDVWLSTSEKMTELFSYEFWADIDKGVALGYPRNDAFSMAELDLHKYFDVDFNKVIVWYPTFRQNHGDISASDSSIALPIIHDDKQAIAINETAKNKKVLIVLKPHFAQDLDYCKDLNLEYIKFIDDDFFFNNDLTSYSFVNSCDALLTDYSSIYFDYMLADKPIGVIWEDYEQYKSRPGFAIDMDYYMQGASKIFTMEDLINFINEIGDSIDLYSNERRKLRDEVHFSTDGQNSKRVVDYIIEHAGL